MQSPKPPPPDPDLKAAQERQQQRLDAKEAQAIAAIAARRMARRIGGKRMLLSGERQDAEAGVQKTLGT
jgi:hypothetical protein